MSHVALLVLLTFSLGGYAQTKQATSITPALVTKAQSGDANAQLQLSLIYSQNGNYKESCRWGRIAAENGNVEAQFILAENYQNGSSTCEISKDASQAVIWFTKAANQGDFEAQDELASRYYNGLGVPKDNSQAAIWWRKSAEQGSPNAQYNLGSLYYNGEGVPQDYVQAEQWFRKAAVLRRGNIDPEKWMRTVANGITAKAEYMIGKIYLLGQGTPVNSSEAADWYRKAAELGNADSQNSLGMLYLFGKGVPQDYAEAYFWLDIAASGKPEDVTSEEADKERDEAAMHLTNAVLLQTQERARKWFDAHE